MQQQPTDSVAMQEVRRLLAERAAKKRELDAIDQALERAAGVDDEDRPQNRRLTGKDVRAMCKVQ